MKTPHISVLIDTYNHEPFIEQAIVSVLEQDFPAAQIEISWWTTDRRTARLQLLTDMLA
jgi:hypothetical protein